MFYKFNFEGIMTAVKARARKKFAKNLGVIASRGAMKKWPVFVLTFLFVASLSFAQETVQSRIKEVILFSSQALVTREASVKVNKGLNELFLKLEAFSVDRDSISAKVFGEGKIFSVQFKEIYLKESPQENIRALEEEIKKLKESKRILSDEEEVLHKKGLFLSSVIDFSRTQVPQDIKTNFPGVEDLGKTLTFLASNFQSINEKKQSLDSRIGEIDTELKVLEKELASLKRPRNEAQKAIEVLFDSEKEQEIKIEASYLAQNAFWKPSYKVSVPLNLEEVDLIMFSNIWQKTGEDWKAVALSISNVVPLRGVGLPSPGSWLLDIQRPRQKAVREGSLFSLQKEAPVPSGEEINARADSEEMYEKEAPFAGTEKKELPLSFEYQIPQALDIESKDKETILSLFTKQLQGEFFYYAVPKVTTLTFLVCKASPDKELLSGPLNVYFGGRFIGKTFLREKKAGEEFHLNLGADREVKTERVKIRDRVKETFFGTFERDKIIREMAFKITLENLKDKPVKIKVLDSIPVSRIDKVQVKDIKITPEPMEKDYQDREGVLLWEFELKPKGKQEVSIEFAIIYPKDFPILGL